MARNLRSETEEILNENIDKRDVYKRQEETLVLEYRMKDGDWHRLRFVEKKRDENGVLTQMCIRDRYRPS